MYDDYDSDYSFIVLKPQLSYNYNTFHTNKHNEHEYTPNMTPLYTKEIVYDNYAYDNVMVHRNASKPTLNFILTNIHSFNFTIYASTL